MVSNHYSSAPRSWGKVDSSEDECITSSLELELAYTETFWMVRYARNFEGKGHFDSTMGD